MTSAERRDPRRARDRQRHVRSGRVPVPRAVAVLLGTLVLVAGGSMSAAAATPAATPPVERWTRQFGTTGFDSIEGVAVDPTGRSFVVGGTDDALAGPGNKGGTDAFIRAYSRSGRHLWTRQFGTSSHDRAKDVAVDPRGFIVVVGDTNGRLPGPRRGGRDAWVRKYRPNGSLVWARQFGSGGEDDGRAVAVDGAGNIFVAGETDGGLAGSPKGGTDVFLRKYSPSGGHRWTRQVGTPVEDWLDGAAADGDGNAWLIISTNGDLEGDNEGDFDAAVRKYRGNGRHHWTRQFGTPVGDFPVDADADGKGALYVVGVTDGAIPGGGADPGERDVFLRKLTRSGGHAWTRQFGTDEADFPYGIDVIGRGTAYVGGATLGELPGENHVGAHDALVASFGPGGGSRWMFQFGTVQSDELHGIAVRRTDDVTVAGSTEGDLARPHQGDGDGFVRRYVPPS